MSSSKSVVEHLISSGCCLRCVLMFCGCRDFSAFQCEASVVSAINQVIYNNSVFENEFMDIDSNEKVTEKSSEDKIHSTDTLILNKIDKICVSCLGLLQEGSLADSLFEKLVTPVVDSGYDSASFLLSIAVPACLLIRTSVVGAQCQAQFKGARVGEEPEKYVTFIKDVWKSLGGPKVSQIISKKFCVGDAPLTVSVNMKYEGDREECSDFMTKIGYTGPKKKKQRDCKRFRYRKPKSDNSDEVDVDALNSTENVDDGQQIESNTATAPLSTEYSRMSLVAALKALNTDQLILCDALVAPEEGSINIVSQSPHHTPVYVAGRYCKYSRTLSQTPWVINGKLKSELSVEEHIAGDVLKGFGSKGDQKFLSSGREDVDVRCLGRGRPFALEIRDPHTTALSRSDMALIQDKINASTSDIQVSHLQLLENKECTSVLRFNTEEKVKSYSALCFIKGAVITDEVLRTLEGIAPVVIHQETPLRVLHRRPLLTRPRTVHTMTASKVNDRFFKISLRTEAGTYIKEFVHGDFGRTQPNLSTMLGGECDIIALDVEDVEVDWPAEIPAE